jgi:hypothetical protein
MLKQIWPVIFIILYFSHSVPRIGVQGNPIRSHLHQARPTKNKNAAGREPGGVELHKSPR